MRYSAPKARRDYCKPASGRLISYVQHRATRFKLSGYAPALPTPFDDEGCIDAVAFERYADLQVAHGATALVVGGTTGEAPTLSSQSMTTLFV